MVSAGKKFTACLLLASAATQVQAQEDDAVAIYREEARSYVAGSVVQFTVEGSVIDQQPGGLLVRMGGRLDDHFGAEVRLGAGLWHEAQRDGLPVPVEKVLVDVDYLVGAYFTGRWNWQMPYVRVPLIDTFYVEGLAGMVNRRVSAEAETQAGLTADSDWDGTAASFGAGLGFDVTTPFFKGPVSLGLQYMDYGSLEDAPANGEELDLSSLEATLQITF